MSENSTSPGSDDARIRALRVLTEMFHDPEKVNLPAPFGEAIHPLLFAARANKTNLVQLALTTGARQDVMYLGMNALLFAVENRSMAILNLLAERHDFKDIINIRNPESLTPVMQAAVNKHWPMVARLLDLGADVELLDRNDCTLLIHILDRVREGNRFHRQAVLLARRLITGGCQVNTEIDRAPCPLSAAVGSECRPLVLLLLGNKADVNHREYDTGETALFHAVRSNNQDITNCLLEYGADPNIVSSASQSPFSLAATLGRLRLVTDMLESNRVDYWRLMPDGVTSHLERVFEGLELASAHHAQADNQPQPLSRADMINLLQTFGVDTARLHLEQRGL
ncbi:ankyrin repeat domain-containing protein [Endozoicomonas sp. SCSIO W0465]|uniref:ankyrin repeat domain-containing protein n=1 Tax=Endozoicomonas sp. SCSIO W0465 TaxID=2918516 RepID=UPI0020752214|nr:ankyrin repeat domain-containing protein [Endozoicomonas sp. SCSIO W0465]USE37764.1 ankyrin repeat domain-containing protein [Endozoicomonas sp. SCSIO W0465]